MSSTGASHARGDSFARQRSTPSKSSPLSPLKLSKLSPAKLLFPNGAGAAGAPHGGAGPRKRLVPLGLVVLGPSNFLDASRESPLTIVRRAAVPPHDEDPGEWGPARVSRSQGASRVTGTRRRELRPPRQVPPHDT